MLNKKRVIFIFLSFQGRIVFCVIFSYLYVSRVSLFPLFIAFIIDIVNGYSIEI